jgi:hypothetical protein
VLGLLELGVQAAAGLALILMALERLELQTWAAAGVGQVISEAQILLVQQAVPAL